MSHEKGLEAARQAFWNAATDYTKMDECLEAGIEAYLAATHPGERYELNLLAQIGALEDELAGYKASLGLSLEDALKEGE